MTYLPNINAAQITAFEGGALHNLPALPFPQPVDLALQERSEQVGALLIALCSCEWRDFFVTKNELRSIAEDELRMHCARLLTKNSRSRKLLTMVFEPGFLTDWDEAAVSVQLPLYRQLALTSINRSTKEHAFHRVLVLLRRQYLSQPASTIPTKLRLRDCNQIIAEFMSEFAGKSEYNLNIVMAALKECELTGGGHLPLQQSRALIKRLKYARAKEAFLSK